MTVKIVPQVYPNAAGVRFVSYAVFINGVFACYARCFCWAVRMGEYLSDGS